MPTLMERTQGFLSRKLDESFSTISFILCLINIIVLIVILTYCKRRQNSPGHFSTNLRHSAGIYAGGEAGNEAAKEATNAYGTITSKLSLVSTISSHSDTDILHEHTNNA